MKPGETELNVSDKVRATLDAARTGAGVKALQAVMNAQPAGRVLTTRKAMHAARTREEMRRAFALQQPQGLGLLFPGLRPRGQRCSR